MFRTKEETNLDINKYLAIDFGLENLCTCATNDRQTFIIDSKKLKSINQFYNKENSRLQAIKDKQQIKGVTKKQYQITKNKNNKVNDYFKQNCKANN